MKPTQRILFPLMALAVLALSACGGGQASNSDAVLTEAAQIAFEALTETAAAASPTPSPSPVPPTATATLAPPTATFTPQGTLPTSTQPAAQQQGGAGTPCLRANLEIETIPDDTEINVGIGFTKTWRLKNTGSCTWTPDFAAIWVEGELLGAKSAVPFTTVDIPPGGYAMIEVPMVAPSQPGTYQGYWMLRGDGVIFGIGNNSRDWFWVKIQTVDPNID